MNVDDATAEAESIALIEKLWPSAAVPPSTELLGTIEAALRLHPLSARLWSLRGDLWQLQFQPWDDEFNPNWAFRCYEKALAIDKTNVDANTEVGYLYDVYFNDFPKAEIAFRNAIASGGDWSSYYGLGRVLAELGRQDEATAILAPDRCPYSNHPEIEELLGEISDGLWNPGPDA